MVSDANRASFEESRITEDFDGLVCDATCAGVECTNAEIGSSQFVRLRSDDLVAESGLIAVGNLGAAADSRKVTRRYAEITTAVISECSRRNSCQDG